MAWIQVHQELPGHPKTARLARALDVSKATAVGHLVCLWLWALDYAESGSLADIDDQDIAAAAEWEGPPAEFITAMVTSRWLDKASDHYDIHDWLEYAGRLVAQRIAHRDRQRAVRAQTATVTNGPPKPRARTFPARERVENNKEDEEPPAASPPVPAAAAATKTRPSDNDFVAQLVTAYEQNIGLITPMIVDDAKDLDEEHHFPADWGARAVGQATKANVRKWTYVKAALLGMVKDGHLPDQNGQQDKRGRQIRADHVYKPGPGGYIVGGPKKKRHQHHPEEHDHVA